MTEPMPYGEMVQELTYLRAQYEQFIIDRERERIINLLKRNIGWIEALEYDYWADELADLITGKDLGRDGENE